MLTPVVGHAATWNAFEHAYDLAGRQLYSLGQDNGYRWMLPDAGGQPACEWKGENLGGTEHWYRFRQVYDALRRPTERWELQDWVAAPNTPAETCTNLAIYGEVLAAPETTNAYSQVLYACDSAGAVHLETYDFKGAPVSQRRLLQKLHDSSQVRLTSTPYDAPLNWSDVVAELLTHTNPTADPVGVASEINTTLAGAGDPEEYLSSMSYDAFGRVVSAVAPHAPSPSATTTTSYTYDEAGAIATISVNDLADVDNEMLVYTEHNARGQRVRMEYGSGVTTAYSYNPKSFRLTKVKSTDDSTPARVLQDLNFLYDAAGNIVKLRDDAQQDVYFNNTVVAPTQTFAYDALYRLTQATGREHAALYGLDPNILPGAIDGLPFTVSTSDPELETYTRNYTYDAAGNLVSLQATGGRNWTRLTPVAANSNRLASASNASSSPEAYTFTASHDQYGQMLATPGIERMKWDAAGNMSLSQLDASADNMRVVYVYGADNQRVRKIVEEKNGSGDWERSKETLYLGGAEVYRTYAGGSENTTRDTVQVMDGDRRLAMIETDDATTLAPKFRYILDNHIRSACIEIDESGAVITYEEFHPYGTTSFASRATASSHAAKRYRYSGKERDTETGLDYYGYRYLCSWLGRWTCPDPAGTASHSNLYVMASGAPVTRIDPNGLFDIAFETSTVSGFDIDSATATREVVRDVHLIAKHSGETGIVVEGTTSTTGGEKHNLELGRARGHVVEQLLMKAGVDPSRIHVANSLGERRATELGGADETEFAGHRGAIVQLGTPVWAEPVDWVDVAEARADGDPLPVLPEEIRDAIRENFVPTHEPDPERAREARRLIRSWRATAMNDNYDSLEDRVLHGQDYIVHATESFLDALEYGNQSVINDPLSAERYSQIIRETGDFVLAQAFLVEDLRQIARDSNDLQGDTPSSGVGGGLDDETRRVLEERNWWYRPQRHFWGPR